MPIEAKQSKNENWDFEVVSERLNRADGSPAPMFANVRTDTNEILGYGTERYGIVQNSDLIATAEQAFASRGIEWGKRNTTCLVICSSPMCQRLATSWATA
jgi:hypothetical protein